MTVTQNLIRWMLLLIFLPLILISSPVGALEKYAINALAHGSIWAINIDGLDYKIQLYGKDQKTGPSGWIRRGIGNTYGKGLLNLRWRGRQATLDMNVPVSNGRQLKCSGIPARNFSFVSGQCDAGVPFIMTSAVNPSGGKSELKNCKRSNQVLKSNNAKSSNTLNRCQTALRDAYQERDTPTSKTRLDGRDIAQNASRDIPYLGGADCGKCDSAPILDVPQNPKSNTQEGRWLSDLLKAQNAAIVDLFGSAGRSEVKAQEGRICQGKKKCFALFRQNVISAAAQKIGGS
ncbi:MAG: hypothetical protein V7750_16515 [Sneathiella sp.]